MRNHALWKRKDHVSVTEQNISINNTISFVNTLSAAEQLIFRKKVHHVKSESKQNHYVSNACKTVRVGLSALEKKPTNQPTTKKQRNPPPHPPPKQKQTPKSKPENLNPTNSHISLESSQETLN